MKSEVRPVDEPATHAEVLVTINLEAVKAKPAGESALPAAPKGLRRADRVLFAGPDLGEDQEGVRRWVKELKNLRPTLS